MSAQETGLVSIEPVAFNNSIGGLLMNPVAMHELEKIANRMATAKITVPKHLVGNEGDCFAIVLQAVQWGMNPYVVAGKTHVINGVMGYEAQLVNAVVNSAGVTTGRINYEWFGDWTKVMGKFKEVESRSKKDNDTGQPLKYRVPDWKIADEQGLGIRVFATMKGESAPRVLELLLTQCRVRNSPLWADDPRQQIAYLGVKRWTRLHCPDVLLGVYTPDELEPEIGERDVSPAATRAEPAKAELKTYNDTEFEKMLPTWRGIIEKKKKTAQGVIAWLSDVAILTDAQIQKIRDLEPILGVAEVVDSAKVVTDPVFTDSTVQEFFENENT